jgi:hypothetical protein
MLLFETNFSRLTFFVFFANVFFGFFFRKMWPKRSLPTLLSNNTWIGDITGALTLLVLVQYLHLWHQLQTPPPIASSRNGAPRAHSASLLALLALFYGRASVLGAQELWKTKAPSADSSSGLLYTVDVGHLTDSGAMGSGMMINVYSVRNAQKHSNHLLFGCVYSRGLVQNPLTMRLAAFCTDGRRPTHQLVAQHAQSNFQISV